MSVKVFQANKAGKIEFTRCELEKLLNETYKEGYRDGENHAKTSIQLGLCELDNTRHKVQLSPLGKAFYGLSQERKKALIPKLCFYIPLLQNYFLTNRSEALLDSWLSILSDSTKKRRRPNVNTLVDIINRGLVDEL